MGFFTLTRLKYILLTQFEGTTLKINNIQIAYAYLIRRQQLFTNMNPCTNIYHVFTNEVDCLLGLKHHFFFH